MVKKYGDLLRLRLELLKVTLKLFLFTLQKLPSTSEYGIKITIYLHWNTIQQYVSFTLETHCLAFYDIQYQNFEHNFLFPYMEIGPTMIQTRFIQINKTK